MPCNFSNSNRARRPIFRDNEHWMYQLHVNRAGAQRGCKSGDENLLCYQWFIVGGLKLYNLDYLLPIIFIVGTIILFKHIQQLSILSSFSILWRYSDGSISSSSSWVLCPGRHSWETLTCTRQNKWTSLSTSHSLFTVNDIQRGESWPAVEGLRWRPGSHHFNSNVEI